MMTIFISLSFRLSGQVGGSERERRHQDEDGYEEEDETKNRDPGRPLAFAYLFDLVKLMGFPFDRANRLP
jgi:hypothetical protein